ncbi:surfeit locus 1 family protein [Rhizobium sp. BK251]|nr:surfeit locus 1 family protein [Rhizobium sp. BK251]
MTDLSKPASRSGGRRIVTGIAVLAALAILLSLGTWQVERLHWKEALLANIGERLAAAPVPFAEIEKLSADGGDIEYRIVSATGRYDNDRERHFFATWNGETGYYVYTPLELPDGRFLFVNRGFVPFERKEAGTRSDGQLTGEQAVTGLARARLPAKPSWLVPDNDVAKNIFYWKDLDVMAQSVGLEKARVLPFFVDADNRANPGGLPVGGVTQIDLPNNHLQYAFTWYGLAAVLVVIVVLSMMRRRRWPEE